MNRKTDRHRTGKRRITTRGQAAVGGRDRDDERGFQPPPQEQDKTPIYVGAGVGGLVLIILIAVFMSGDGGGKRNKDHEAALGRMIVKVEEARKAGDHHRALQLLDEILADPRFKSLDRRPGLEAMAATERQIVNAERDAGPKIDAFKAKVDSSRAEGTAMKRAKEFWEECNGLLQLYGTTSRAQTLRDIKQDLTRWLATESQDTWQKDYNQVKARIEREHIAKGNFAMAVRDWTVFKETSQDPLLHSRVDSEVTSMNIEAKKAAEALCAAGDVTRQSLEDAIPRFAGTDGQKVINSKLRSMK